MYCTCCIYSAKTKTNKEFKGVAPRPTSAPRATQITKEKSTTKSQPFLAASKSRVKKETKAARSTPINPEENPNTMPLFRLAQLTKEQQRVNTKKLVTFLDKNGKICLFYGLYLIRFLMETMKTTVITLQQVNFHRNIDH